MDPWEAAKALGLRVDTVPLESADGFLRRPPGCDWYVLVSSLLPRHRQRFTLAHQQDEAEAKAS